MSKLIVNINVTHNSTKLVKLIIFTLFNLINIGSCDFTYGYESDEFTLAIINFTYTDPVTGNVRSEREEFGKYSIGRIGSVSGLLVHVTSNQHVAHDACEPIDTDIFPMEPWIALAQYGNCRESVKLKNIANTNASGAVIYHNKSGTRLLKMHHKTSNLISVFISKEKGETVAAMMENGTRVTVHISIGTHSGLRYANINRTSVLFVSISFIVLMIISLAWLIFYYVQRFRYIHAKDILARRLSNAAKKAMDKIPTKTIRPSDLESIYEGELAECCAVCIEPFKTSDVVRILPCKHLFHKSCVDPWLIDNRSCPMCKMDILKHYGLAYTGSQESVLNIDDIDISHHYYHRGRHRSSSGEVEIVHVPIPIRSPMRGDHTNGRRPRDNRGQSTSSSQTNQRQSHNQPSALTASSSSYSDKKNNEMSNEESSSTKQLIDSSINAFSSDIPINGNILSLNDDNSSQSSDGNGNVMTLLSVNETIDKVNNICVDREHKTVNDEVNDETMSNGSHSISSDDCIDPLVAHESPK